MAAYNTNPICCDLEVLRDYSQYARICLVVFSFFSYGCLKMVGLLFKPGFFPCVRAYFYVEVHSSLVVV